MVVSKEAASLVLDELLQSSLPSALVPGRNQVIGTGFSIEDSPDNAALNVRMRGENIIELLPEDLLKGWWLRRTSTSTSTSTGPEFVSQLGPYSP